MLQARLAEKEVIPPSTQDRRDFVSHFIEAKETHPGQVSDQTLVGYIMTILLVGSDSTSVALRAIVYYILKNIKVLTRLRQEIDDAKLTYPVSFQQSQELTYLDAVIKESHRYHPAGSILLEREVPETGLQLPDGRFVPAGTTVGMVGWTVHLNKDVFGADADTFNPNRWLQGGNETSEAFRLRLQGMKNAEITFGHGTRSCIGKHIAALEIYKLIPTMFGLFDVGHNPG
jgi:cytochrome P450